MMKPSHCFLFLALVAIVPSAAEDAAEVAIPGSKTVFWILKEGSGQEVSKGSSVTVHAKGIIKSTGKKFWDTRDTNSPFTYKAGVGSVITGWDKGALGMKLGEVRKLSIPADEGYGARGFPSWGITPNADLLFEIEVLTITN